MTLYKRSSGSVQIGILLILALTIVSFVRADPAVVVTPQWQLYVLDGPGLTKSGVLNTYNFGQARATDGTTIRHTFLLRNDNPRPVTLDRVQGSCGCTTGAVQEAINPGGHLVIAPGQIIHLEAALDAAHLSSSSIDKFVSVFIIGQPWPAALLEIAGSWQGSDGMASGSPLDSGRAAPPFALTDAQGNRRAFVDFHGRAVSLFFFCGCPWCVECAKAWGRLQEQDTVAPSLPPTRKARWRPVTLIVFAGDADAARSFAAETSLDPAQTVLLPDPAMRVTAEYQADPCPRVFAVDRNGFIRYTNNHPDDAPRVAKAQTIAARAFGAIPLTRR